MTLDEENATSLSDIKNEMVNISATLIRMSRNQTIAICVFTLVMLVVLIQEKRIELDIPGILTIKSAGAEGK